MPVIAITRCESCGRDFAYGLRDLVILLKTAVWPAPGNCPHCEEMSHDTVYSALTSAMPRETYHRDGIWNISAESALGRQGQDRLGAVMTELTRA